MNIQVTKSTALKEKVPVNQLGFGRVFTDHMFIVEAEDGRWDGARIVPFGPFPLHPAATVLHYGQELFEGLKAYRASDGRILLFRAKDNFHRINEGARRLALPEIDVDFAYEALNELLKIDASWVPDAPETSLYIRPFMFGNDPHLGVSAAKKVMFSIICSPSGAYYKTGLAPIKIYVENQYVRAVRGGMGYTKAGANYAASLLAGVKAHEKGFSQVLWLDGIEQKYVEEVGSMNIFFLFNDALVTPELQGSILSGITRRSIITLAQHFGIPVEERKLPMSEVFERHARGELLEVFGSGTAAVVSPVCELRWGENSMHIGEGQIGKQTQRFYDVLTGIQYGRLKDEFGWVSEVK